MADRQKVDFVERVETANRARFEGRPLYQIGDVLQPTVPVVEGVWSIKGRTVVETDEDETINPDRPLIDDTHPIAASDKTWFIAFVAPAASSLRRVRRFMGRLGFAAYWPREVAMVIRGRGDKRRPVPIVSPLFPRYVLVHLPAKETPFGILTNDEAKFNGVAGIVSTLGRPIIVPNTIVARIVERERSGEFNGTMKKRKKTVAKVPEWAVPGAIVTLKSGPFATYYGAIEEIDEIQSRVKVAVEIFGRATPVELPLADVGELC